MKKKFAKLVLITGVITGLLLSCTKTTLTERRVDPPPPDTVIVSPPATDTTDTVINSKKWIVSTFAGADSGKADGDSIYALFNNPAFITIDPQDNLFVSGVLNFNIRKITPSAHVTTWTGWDIITPNPVWGNFYGLSIDKQGALFVTDGYSIRKINSPTDISVLAGNGSLAIQDGTGTGASFSNIYYLAIDKDDNLYVADTDVNGGYPYIPKITPGGVVTTLQIQDNTGVPDYGGPQIYWNCAIAIDKNGTIYRAANEDRVIKKITPDGKMTVFAGSGTTGFTDGQGTAASFASVTGMVADSTGTLYVTDSNNGAIRKITPDGVVTTIAGRAGVGYKDGEGSVAKFHNPTGIAISRDGALFITDTWNNRIRKMEYK